MVTRNTQVRVRPSVSTSVWHPTVHPSLGLYIDIGAIILCYHVGCPCVRLSASASVWRSSVHPSFGLYIDIGDILLWYHVGCPCVCPSVHQLVCTFIMKRFTFLFPYISACSRF